MQQDNVPGQERQHLCRTVLSRAEPATRATSVGSFRAISKLTQFSAQPEHAIKNFFSERNLTALRELTLQHADRPLIQIETTDLKLSDEGTIRRIDGRTRRSVA
jgi:hypothetical protein